MKTSEFLDRFCSQGRYSKVRENITARFPDEEDIQRFQDTAGLRDDSAQLLPLIETAAIHGFEPSLFAAWVRALGGPAAYWNLDAMRVYSEAGVPPEYVAALDKRVQTNLDVVVAAWRNDLAPVYVF